MTLFYFMSDARAESPEDTLFQSLQNDPAVLGVLRIDCATGNIIAGAGDFSTEHDSTAIYAQDVRAVLLRVRDIINSEPSEAPESLVRVVCT